MSEPRTPRLVDGIRFGRVAATCVIVAALGAPATISGIAPAAAVNPPLIAPVPPGENAPAGTVSKATFDGNSLTLEYFDHDHLGTFIRATPAE